MIPGGGFISLINLQSDDREMLKKRRKKRSRCLNEASVRNDVSERAEHPVVSFISAVRGAAARFGLAKWAQEPEIAQRPKEVEP